MSDDTHHDVPPAPPPDDSLRLWPTGGAAAGVLAAGLWAGWLALAWPHGETSGPLAPALACAAVLAQLGVLAAFLALGRATNRPGLQSAALGVFGR